VATLPGLDGRKMSKSYNNTIPLFEGGLKSLQAAVARIVTDSKLPGEPKDPESTHLLPIYRAFASADQVQSFVEDLKAGLAWGEAKQRLVYVIEEELGPKRETYARLMANPDDIEDALALGARKARELARPFMEQLREAVGLRNTVKVSKQSKAAKKKTARMLSFRLSDDTFRFKLVSATGQELAISEPHADPKQVGAIIRNLQERASDIVIEPVGELNYRLVLAGEKIAQGAECESSQARDELMKQVRQALDELVQE